MVSSAPCLFYIVPVGRRMSTRHPLSLGAAYHRLRFALGFL